MLKTRWRGNVLVLAGMVSLLAAGTLASLTFFIWDVFKIPDDDWVDGAVFGGIVATFVNAFILALTGIVNTMGTIAVDPPPNALLDLELAKLKVQPDDED